MLPNGSTVLMSFLVMSPALTVARMPPPFVMATTFSAGTEIVACVRIFQSMASVIRSPRLVSESRLPLGAFAPLSSTLLTANFSP